MFCHQEGNQLAETIRKPAVEVPIEWIYRVITHEAREHIQSALARNHRLCRARRLFDFSVRKTCCVHVGMLFLSKKLAEEVIRLLHVREIRMRPAHTEPLRGRATLSFGIRGRRIVGVRIQEPNKSRMGFGGKFVYVGRVLQDSHAKSHTRIVIGRGSRL